MRSLQDTTYLSQMVVVTIFEKPRPEPDVDGQWSVVTGVHKYVSVEVNVTEEPR